MNRCDIFKPLRSFFCYVSINEGELHMKFILVEENYYPKPDMHVDWQGCKGYKLLIVYVPSFSFASSVFCMK